MIFIATLFVFLFFLGLILFVVGMIKPAMVVRWIKDPGRKQVALYYGLSSVICFFMIGVFAPPTENKNNQASNIKTEETANIDSVNSNAEATDLNVAETVNQNSLSEDVGSASNVPTENVNSESIDNKKFYKVVSVVDGDTIKVVIDGKTETIRLIGVDTPETVDPRKPVQCFGKEASNKAKEWLLNKEVELEADASQGDRDKYNRMLRYVRVKDDIFYNLEIIKQGYAHEYTYGAAYKHQADFRGAEKYARDNKLGLWADNTCAGDTTKSATVSVTAPVSPITTPIASNPIDASKCLIKGNITSEKIYHLPGCGSYDKTVIDESAGEKWFCTETEAVAAGWRKAKNCP